MSTKISGDNSPLCFRDSFAQCVITDFFAFGKTCEPCVFEDSHEGLMSVLAVLK
jgi:hypothetical protein